MTKPAGVAGFVSKRHTRKSTHSCRFDTRPLRPRPFAPGTSSSRRRLARPSPSSRGSAPEALRPRPSSPVGGRRCDRLHEMNAAVHRRALQNLDHPRTLGRRQPVERRRIHDHRVELARPASTRRDRRPAHERARRVRRRSPPASRARAPRLSASVPSPRSRSPRDRAPTPRPGAGDEHAALRRWRQRANQHVVGAQSPVLGAAELVDQLEPRRCATCRTREDAGA